MGLHTLSSLIVAALLVTEIVALECIQSTHIKGDGYETFYDVDDFQRKMQPDVHFEMYFATKTSQDALILLSNVQNPSDDDSVYEIVLGGGTNTFADLRSKKKRNSIAAVYRNDIVSNTQLRYFYIRIYNGGKIVIGKVGADSPLISHVDKNPLQVKYFTFGSFVGGEADFLFDCQTNDILSSTESTQETETTTEIDEASTTETIFVEDTTPIDEASTTETIFVEDTTPIDEASTTETIFVEDTTPIDEASTTETIFVEDSTPFDEASTTETIIVEDSTPIDEASTTETIFVEDTTPIDEASTTETIFVEDTTPIDEASTTETILVEDSTLFDEASTTEATIGVVASTTEEAITTYGTTGELYNGNKVQTPHIITSIKIDRSGTVTASLGPLMENETSLVPKFGILIAAIAKHLHGGYGTPIVYSNKSPQNEHNNINNESNRIAQNVAYSWKLSPIV